MPFAAHSQILFILVTFFLASCNTNRSVEIYAEHVVPAVSEQANNQADPNPGEAIHKGLSDLPAYNFEEPVATFELQKRLKEISGLTVLDENRVAAVQDEDGKVFIIDLKTGKVEDDFRFEENGDYEGIEMVGDTLFVLRSDGTLFEIASWSNKDDRITRKIKTPLKSRHDTEGLAYDKSNNRLLVLCKEFPGDGLKGSKAIYAYDLLTEEMDEVPVLTIDLEAAEQLQDEEQSAYLRLSRKILSKGFDTQRFKPAAIAIHPQTNHIFVVSSVEKILLALAQNGSIEAAWSLPEKLFRQPEGLAFMPNGDLLVSNEASGKDATLLRYHPN